MRRLSLILVMIASLCASARADELSADEVERQVMSRFDSLVAAAKSLDTEAYFGHFDRDNFTALNEDGTVAHSFERFQQDFAAGIEAVERYVSLEFNEVKVSVISPSTAILVNEYKAVVVLVDGSNAEFFGAGSQVWQRSEGSWWLVSVSSSTKRQ